MSDDPRDHTVRFDAEDRPLDGVVERAEQGG